MATEQNAKWRNAAAWTVAGIVIYGIGALGSVLFFRGQYALAAIPESATAIATLAGGVALASIVLGLSKRNAAFGLKRLFGVLITTGLFFAVVVAAKSSVAALAGPLAASTMRTSAMVALGLSLILIASGLLGLLLTGSGHARALILSPDLSEIVIERKREHLYSYLSLIAMGLSLIVLSLAGIALSPVVALVAVAILGLVQVGLTLAVWPLLDELSRALSRETGNASFYLITMFGGGWAILAHLGFVVAPAPLDWLTIFTVAMFAAAIVAAIRRGLLKSD